MNGVLVIDDFAHHPTAVRETIVAIRQRYPDRRLWAVFEPRSNTSRRNIHQHEYATRVRAARRSRRSACPEPHDKVPLDEQLDIGKVVDALRAQGIDANASRDVDELVQRVVDRARAGDVVLVMSNGSVRRVHPVAARRAEGQVRLTTITRTSGVIHVRSFVPSRAGAHSPPCSPIAVAATVAAAPLTAQGTAAARRAPVTRALARPRRVRGDLVGGTRILIDPFLTGNPTTPDSLKQLARYNGATKPAVILVSHSHFDHTQDAKAIATAGRDAVVGRVRVGRDARPARGAGIAAGTSAAR